MILDNEKDFLNDYATRSLRFTADQDYISARACYKAELTESFLWLSLHAIEKYLKAILLFNAIPKPRKSYGHNVENLLDAVEKIREIDLRLPMEVYNFIKYINHFGENRYFDSSVFVEEYALDKLDTTVWYIRKHCYDMEVFQGSNLKIIEPQEQENNPKKYRLSGGLLEKIVQEKPLSYSYLAWDNWFYGEEAFDREAIRKRQNKILYISPTLDFFGKDAFDILDKYIFFPSGTRKFFS